MDTQLDRANLLKPVTKQGTEGCATTNDATTKCFHQ